MKLGDGFSRTTIAAQVLRQAKGDLEAALTMLKQAERQQPDKADWYRECAFWCRLIKEHPEAVEDEC